MAKFREQLHNVGSIKTAGNTPYGRGKKGGNIMVKDSLIVLDKKALEIETAKTIDELKLIIGSIKNIIKNRQNTPNTSCDYGPKKVTNEEVISLANDLILSAEEKLAKLRHKVSDSESSL